MCKAELVNATNQPFKLFMTLAPSVVAATISHLEAKLVICEVIERIFPDILLEQGFLTWGASTPRGRWNRFQGVLVKVTYVAVKGKRNTFGQRC